MPKLAPVFRTSRTETTPSPPPGRAASTAYGIMVLTTDGDHIIEITGFADPALFPAFGLPARMEG